MIKAGDRVRLKAIHEGDAFYSMRDEYVGRVGTVAAEDSLYKLCKTGDRTYGCRIKFDSEESIHTHDPYFAFAEVEVINEEEKQV